jgi:hypothetical protein
MDAHSVNAYPTHHYLSLDTDSYSPTATFLVDNRTAETVYFRFDENVSVSQQASWKVALMFFHETSLAPGESRLYEFHVDLVESRHWWRTKVPRFVEVDLELRCYREDVSLLEEVPVEATRTVPIHAIIKVPGGVKVPLQLQCSVKKAPIQ